MAENRINNPIDELVDAAQDVVDAWAGGEELPRARLIAAVRVLERARNQAWLLKSNTAPASDRLSPVANTEVDSTRQLALFIRQGLLLIVRRIEQMYGLKRSG